MISIRGRRFASSALLLCIPLLSGCPGEVPQGGTSTVAPSAASSDVKVVGFDEDDVTLQAIIDGKCHGTVVQNPYMYGYESVRVLAGLAKGDKSVLPENGYTEFPARRITAENAEEFWTDLNQKLEILDTDPPAADSSKPTVAFVTNGVDRFWDIAEAGARQGALDFDVNLEVRMPVDGIADQRRMIEELLTIKVDGMAVSPIDADNLTDILNTAAAATNLITHDSDAPLSNRLAYIGTSNYDAGRMCGELVKEAMPDGGSVMIFVGRLEQDNAKLRRQGVIDELLDREHDANREPDPEQELAGEKYTILATRTDGFDRTLAKTNVEDCLAAHPDIGCLVGLFAYNPPAILDALRGASR